jgi:TonB family protein
MKMFMFFVVLLLLFACTSAEKERSDVITEAMSETSPMEIDSEVIEKEHSATPENPFVIIDVVDIDDVISSYPIKVIGETIEVITIDGIDMDVKREMARTGNAVINHDSDTIPEIKKKVSPEFPKFARISRDQSIVVLDFELLADGTVGIVKVIRSLIPELDEIAVNAVRQWEFTSAISGGKEVVCWMKQSIYFEQPRPVSFIVID